MNRTLQRWYWDHMAAWCILFRQHERGLSYYMKILAADPQDTLALASIAYRYAKAGWRWITGYRRTDLRAARTPGVTNTITAASEHA